ncbi:hypothetical protein [Paraburkholderia megapolitana]|nr:hypothetical protein [Paraburkholderia megapolitana]QDQ82997.1 hypothetical protein FNZ07_17365 [Paraburkholderia megapolitana]
MSIGLGHFWQLQLQMDRRVATRNELIIFSTMLLAVQSGKNRSTPEKAMFTEAIKRILWILVPAALITFVIQYRETGNVSALGIVVYVIAFLATTMAFEGLNVLWTRRFGTSKASGAARAAVWFAVAVCMYLFFRHFDKG